MVSSPPPKGYSRRHALKVAAVLPAVAVSGELSAPRQARAYDPGADETRARYRETDDVKAFYRTNGYETLKK